MNSTPSRLTLQALRTQVEDLLQHQAGPVLQTPAQLQRLLLELQTQQTEIEMQYEELLAAQQSAEMAQAEYAQLYEHAPIAYITIDATGLIERVNQRACQLLGTIDARRLEGQRFLVFVAPGSQPVAACWLAQAHNGAAPPAIELELLLDSGQTCRVQLNGDAEDDAAGPRPCRLALLDLTERHRAAAELRRSQKRTRLALAASGAGVVEWDCATNLLYLDELARGLFGLPGPPAQLPLEVLQAQVMADDQAALATALNYAVAGTPLALEFRVRAEPGPPRYLAAHGEVVFETGARLHFIGQVRDITAARRTQDEAEDARLHQQQAVFEAVLATQEEERRRMAETLHNGVGQLLYLAKLHLGQMATTPASAAEALLDEAIRDVRTLSAVLSPAVLEEAGLQAALETMARRVPSSLRVHCNFQGLEVPLPPSLATLVFRTVQELLNNVLKHAGATEVFLHVVREPQLLLVDVDDDGQGFDPQGPGKEPPGIGLVSIRNQVARLGGHLSVVAQPGQGTAISIELPVAEVV